MREYKRILLLVLIMTAVAVSIGGFAVLILYETAIGEERQWLVEAATRQARLIEAIARQEQTVHRSADEGRAAALSEVFDSLAALGRSSRRAEFLLGESSFCRSIQPMAETFPRRGRSPPRGRN